MTTRRSITLLCSVDGIILGDAKACGDIDRYYSVTNYPIHLTVALCYTALAPTRPFYHFGQSQCSFWRLI